MLYIQVEKNFSVHTVREYESDLLDFFGLLTKGRN
ncbi:site-specific integrase [Lysinibacillus sp. MHQ-1]|nr:site-specific integrase [Lysinibacillus sp. MHQ-1]